MTARELHFVVPGPLDQRTGGYLYDAHIVAGLRARGWRVVVVELPGSFPDPDRQSREGLRAALASRSDGSLVVIDGLAMGGLPEAIDAHRARLKILSLVHHPLAEETGLSDGDRRRFSELERRALAGCSGVLVTSPFTAGRLTDYGVPPARVRSVPPGTVPAPPAVGPPAGEPPRLLSVASLTPRKGCDVLVSALERVRDLGWSCVIAGSLERDPEHARTVLDRVQRSGLEARVTLVGEREAEELDELYAGSSLFVLASHYEGYGMALADALARGLPIVSTTGGAIPFTVPAEAGVLVRPGDAEAFADALRTLIGSPKRRDAFASAARRHAKALPTWDEAVRGFARAVEELAK